MQLLVISLCFLHSICFAILFGRIGLSWTEFLVRQPKTLNIVGSGGDNVEIQNFFHLLLVIPHTSLLLRNTTSCLNSE